MAKFDVAVIGAGAAGLTAGALLAKHGKKVVVLDRSAYLGGRGMAVPDQGFKLNVGGHLLEDSGSGITKVFEHLGKHLGHGAVSSDMPVWDHERERWGSIRDRYSGEQGRAQEGDQRPARDALRGVRQVGRSFAARMDASAHQRPGRDRPMGVRCAARMSDRGVVGPLRQRQPLRAQDALPGEAHGRLLVLARAGLGRPVRRPRRRAHRERGRAAPRSQRRAGGDREPPGQGCRDRAPAADPAQRDVRG